LSWEIILLVVISLYSIVVSFYCFKFAILILKVQDSIENSLDKLDKRYFSVDEIMQRPLFYDSPEIRKVLEDISGSKAAILEVANTLTKDFNQDDLDKVDDEG
tara:strand:- start:24 stop:332 length:309 start_codon:yes stop_codon:yes gene_type:complete